MDGEGGVIFPDKVIPVKSASLVTDVPQINKKTKGLTG
jgi:hypothetical protein